MGVDNFENSQIDAQIDSMEDVIQAVRKVLFSPLRNPQMTEDERANHLSY